MLSVRGLSRPGIVDDVSFDIRAGEILALVGLAPSDRCELARLIFGFDRRNGGTVELDGRPVAVRSPREAAQRGILLLPERSSDRGRRSGQLSVSPAGRDPRSLLLGGGDDEPRLVIAGALAGEPAAGADGAAHELIRSFAARGTAVFVLSQEAGDVAELAHRALVLRAGRIVVALAGTGAELVA